jgi:hypothetical protein
MTLKSGNQVKIREPLGEKKNPQMVVGNKKTAIIKPP